MKTARQRLCDYIRQHPLVSVAELSQVMKVTEANIRYHLTILQEQGLVEEGGQKNQVAKGRPATLYKLSEQTLGHNLDCLSDALLTELFSDLSSETQREILQRTARRMLDGLSKPQSGITEVNSSKTQTLTRRLNGVIRLLNLLNYQARWEAHAEGPRLVLIHCPYKAVINTHPELCQLDRYFLQGLLDTPVVQLIRHHEDQPGLSQCLFQVGRSESVRR